MKTLISLIFLLAAWPAAALDGAQILLKVDRNLEPESYEMYRKLINIEPDGKRKEFVLYSVKKGRDKVIALFLAPASDKGRATLRLNDNMWLHIPEVGKPMRITSLQSVTGGGFAYDRLKMRVDKKTILPTTIECYAASGMLIKTLRFKDIKDFGGGIRRPATLETDSPLYKEHKSVMLYSQIKKREFPDEVFTLNNLPRVEDLRK